MGALQFLITHRTTVIGSRGRELLVVKVKVKMATEVQESTVLKVVIIGDGAVGKTALMVRYRDGRFPSDYIPTVFEMNAKTVEVDNEKFELRLWDTAGQEAYEELRKQAYIGAQVIIIGFCLVNRCGKRITPRRRKMQRLSLWG